MHYQASLDGTAPPRVSNTMFKAVAALFAGACIGFVSMRSFPELQSTSAATSLISGPTSLRQGAMPSVASLPGASPWKELAIAAIQSSNGCQRDVSMKANSPFKTALANLNSEEKAKYSRFSVMAQAKAKSLAADVESLPGIVSPWGFWDPLGLSTDLTEGKLLFYREAEIKHGRVCMQATLGFLVGERFHPLFGGDVDQPSALVFQTTAVDFFWPAALAATGFIELAAGKRINGDRELVPGLTPGDLGWDPLGLQTDLDSDEYVDMQNREILHGRLAMISIVGMVAEELVTGEKLQWLKLFTGPGGGV